MKKLIITPAGWPCKLRECPPGLFIHNPDILCVKTDYGKTLNGDVTHYADAYLADGGDAFWGGVIDLKTREELVVQPVRAIWIEVEE